MLKLNLKELDIAASVVLLYYIRELMAPGSQHRPSGLGHDTHLFGYPSTTHPINLTPATTTSINIINN